MGKREGNSSHGSIKIIFCFSLLPLPPKANVFPIRWQKKRKRRGEDEGKKHSRTTKIEIRRCSILPRKKRANEKKRRRRNYRSRVMQKL
jgi:hypothetical protein